MILSTFSRAALAVLALGLSACTTFEPEDLPPLGDFRLGHNVVLAQGVTKGPFSRDAEPEELTEALAEAIEDRLLGYDGDGLYHLGISIGGYVLALPGVPVVYSPKSVMIFDVTVYDNDTGEKLNEEPYRITAFEGLENTSILGSGLVRSKTEQLDNLVNDAARQLHQWLQDNPDWFIPDPDQARTAFDRAEWEAKLDEALATQGDTPPTVPSDAPEAETPPEAEADAPVDAGGGTVTSLALPPVEN